MHCNSKTDNDKEELVSSSQPPPYEAAVNTTFQQQQQLPPTVVLNNTTVIQQVPIISLPIALLNPEHFCSETPREVRRIFIRWALTFPDYISARVSSPFALLICNFSNLFLVISAQFLLIDGIIAMIIFVPFVHDKMMDKRNSSNFYIIWIVSIIVLAIISFWERARRIPPANYVTIIIFTIFQGITLGCAATFK